ncbi:hypothetical protein COA01_32540 [Bacillus cereus]|uniref:prepilin-type N-terminal cleavage/methylation domain-containing protein n=1 Tax=Bacillus cereus TaxID=1396 RepID=UPI000BFD4C6F|nr:prepilin-type N-terminal cleavage/methylation domain-containing protein [Bacillus cereus]PGP12546.1 hypothetical protein COA01_32540 [Bacillus cereus]
MNNQKGLTTIELLISLFILAIILTASANFYEFYDTKSENFGSFNTARNLGVSVLENQLETTKLGYKTIGEVYRKSVYVKGKKYEVVAERIDATDTTSYYNKNIPFYLIKTKVYFEDKEIEVNGYVTSK